ncbi:hypothetical protein PILCRDRAFT_13023 [Piloderma croceum F 1598]|uniref:Uncharacterized protein n=1 Tax=Piloderma croceum (strain F 1598) TaxID=765440 RepID=A0A0C3F8U9_PILCF|nr:hypothetical protein PILCRDRAFT_13023 [Piloderma croceum F 1598]
MSTPSTTSYTPFDSDALGVFSGNTTLNYLIVGFLGLLLYDHTITLDRELQVDYPLVALSTYIELWYRGTSAHYTCLLAVYALVRIKHCCELNLTGPTDGHRKLFVWALGGFFVLALGCATASETLYGRYWHIVLYYEFLPGCWLDTNHSTIPTQWPMWAVFLSVEGVLMLLTAYKVISYRKELNPTITMLARDSLVYFIIIFASLASMLATDVAGDLFAFVKVPTQSITCIAVGRMMMNIRGLILDDPEHTTHLQTLEFAARTNSSSEIEEVV